MAGDRDLKDVPGTSIIGGVIRAHEELEYCRRNLLEALKIPPEYLTEHVDAEPMPMVVGDRDLSADALVERWAKSGLLDGVTPERKRVIATVLANQARCLEMHTRAGRFLTYEKVVDKMDLPPVLKSAGMALVRHPVGGGDEVEDAVGAGDGACAGRGAGGSCGDGAGLQPEVEPEGAGVPLQGGVADAGERRSRSDE